MSLRQAFSGPHWSQKVTGAGERSEHEIDDLIAYLKKL
jgi:hypothetical protein